MGTCTSVCIDHVHSRCTSLRCTERSCSLAPTSPGGCLQQSSPLPTTSHSESRAKARVRNLLYPEPSLAGEGCLTHAHRGTTYRLYASTVFTLVSLQAHQPPPQNSSSRESRSTVTTTATTMTAEKPPPKTCLHISPSQARRKPWCPPRLRLRQKLRDSRTDTDAKSIPHQTQLQSPPQL